ncbi:MAG: TIM barrel protein [Candidatus Sumerlaeota bacterium]|nr:TIM barrel protein [Candidatus Sumerlaeota bacterium]
MPFTFGMPALIELPDITSHIDLCKELGLSFIELNMNIPWQCPENLAPDFLKSLTINHGIGFSLHLPEETDMGSFHLPVRQGHMVRCEEAFLWSARAGVPMVNLHLNNGVYFSLPDKKVWLYQKYQPLFLENLLSGFDRLANLARDNGIKICIENSYNFHLPFIGEAVRNLMNIPQIFLTWDTGHDARTGFKERALLLQHEERIAHMHLHDYNGVSDHQIPFTGNINIREMLTFAKRRNISVIIEVKTVDALRESVSKLHGDNALDVSAGAVQ